MPTLSIRSRDMNKDRAYYDSLTEYDGGRFAVSNTEEADAFCKSLALGSYENFPVGSLLIPKKIRPHFYAVYAYCRIADDLGDEYPGNPEERINALAKFEALLDVDYSGNIETNPIFRALSRTIKQCNIPIRTLKNLLEAFRSDVRFEPRERYEELLQYCKYSANPVGEAVLRIFDNYGEQTAKHSDMICTALQLANFWQDVSRDKEIGRCYIPRECFPQGTDKKELSHLELLEDAYRQNLLGDIIEELCIRAEKMFSEGRKLIPMLDSFRLRREISAVIAGGEIICRKTRDIGNDIYKVRPEVSKFEILRKLIFPG